MSAPGEYEDEDVADDSTRHEAEPEGSFVDKDVAERAAAERRKGEYEDEDVADDSTRHAEEPEGSFVDTDAHTDPRRAAPMSTAKASTRTRT